MHRWNFSLSTDSQLIAAFKDTATDFCIQSVNRAPIKLRHKERVETPESIAAILLFRHVPMST